ncbi:MAG: D-alanyl-D-alanine carboxypeptidase [Clostridium sp.]|jgi:D-alanyl-D-alanine carboxypeptidase (penicillin-binding protein 5/6)|nr:D-alanyl-D-alanine carboxypeptidase [Clostridium sp.]
MNKPTKLLICLCLALLLALTPICASAGEGEAIPVAGETDSLPVSVNAKAAVLMDAGSGQILAQANEHEKLYPASVTKIMPLLLVMEALDGGGLSLADKVTASRNAAGKGGSQIWLKEGEVMSVEELLKAAAIYSANDACTALGEHIFGSEEAFVDALNRRARELGMGDTHFDNGTGLDDATTTHLTSANDVAIMSRELLKHPAILSYTTVWMDYLRDGETQLVNTNKLVRFYEGATGLKTGTTNKAGCCISASAKRGDLQLIAVVMGSPNSDERFNGAKALLNWGFANYAALTPVLDPALVPPVKVLRGTSEEIQPKLPQIAPVVMKKGEEGKLKQEIQLALDVQAPVEEGQLLGRVIYSLDGKTLAEYPLTAPAAVEKMSFGEMFLRLLRALG